MLKRYHRYFFEEYYSYLWCATRDMNLENYQDNLGRPITDMYLTVLPTNKNLLILVVPCTEYSRQSYPSLHL